MLRAKKLIKIQARFISKYLDADITCKAIRQKFLDYFIKEHNHSFVRSSPVVPFCDPTVAFVNAGMNQFKTIFLGTQQSRYKRVANSQKCVRVGGRHNDLNIVGTDGYHHTFFEMLGNWSFNDYFKQEACELAWNLLTKEYKINKNRLYVTYFNGDRLLHLEPDLECREIWRKLGVPEDRILPFGLQDNFWEMGMTGPCGPCTEIHVDHLGAINRRTFVNKGLPDLTELWNIVFITYNKSIDGSINSLPHKHVDTGMGLERLATLLQGKLSNYDSDVFTYLFSAIKKNCKAIPKYEGKFGESDWNGLDTTYRILADHARMVTVCLADGMIPEQNQKLRRIIRKAFFMSETSFKRPEGLLKELTNYVVENLGPTYPELERNVNQIKQIIDFEEDVYRSIRKQATKEWGKIVKDEPRLAELDVIELPGLINAYKDLKTATAQGAINGLLAFKLYDTHGLEEDLIRRVAMILNLSFDSEGFHQELVVARLRSKEQAVVENADAVLRELITNQIKTTNDSYKYRYHKSKNDYVFADVHIKVLKIIYNENFVTDIGPNIECSLLLDKTNLYSESGGQSSDVGTVTFHDGIFQVNEIQNVNGYILHKGVLVSNKSGKVRLNEVGTLKVDPGRRLNTMRNHTAAHLLNASLKRTKGTTCQKSSKITDSYLKLDVGIFSSKLSPEEIKKIDVQINDVIQNNCKVKVRNINSQELLEFDDVTLVPGEIYPDIGIRLLEIKGREDFISREPCCGTHVLNSADLEDFCIVSCRSLGRSTTSIHAVTGPRAQLARQNGDLMWNAIISLKKDVENNTDKAEVLDLAVTNLRKQFNFNIGDTTIVPLTVKHDCLNVLDEISKEIKSIAKDALLKFIEMEMQHALQTKISQTKSNKKYLVHYLQCSTMLDTVPLHKATNICSDVPVLVISYSDNTVKARCCVPENLRSSNFNAEKWLQQTVGLVFDSNISFAKGEDSTVVCNMKEKRVTLEEDWDTLLNKSLDSAKSFVEDNL